MTEKNKKIIKFRGLLFVVILSANIVFLGLNSYYNSSSLGSFLTYTKTINELDPNSDIFSKTRLVPTSTQFYTGSLINIFIQPIFMFLVLSSFVNYLLIRKLKVLEKEITEIREKIDA
jgi:hypothetical protein